MAQFKNLLASLGIRQRIYILATIVLVAGSLYWLVNWKKEQDFRPLYSGLAAEDAMRCFRSCGDGNRIPTERKTEPRCWCPRRGWRNCAC